MPDFVENAFLTLQFKAVFIAMAFAAITVIAWLKAGRDAMEWSGDMRKSGLVNIGLVAFNAFAIVIPMAAAIALLGWMQSVPHISASVWDDAPWVLRAFAALLIFDLVNYAIHRWSHVNKWIWPLHAVHHSDTQMHFLTANRAHVLEWLIAIPLTAAVGFLCGLSIGDVVMLGLIREAHQYYVHSNLDWSHGPLRHVIAGPRFHRWHHVDREDAYDKNFSLFFPFIDVAFGTYYVPGPAKGMATGFDDNPGENFTKLMLYPFTEWAKLARQSFKRHPAAQDVSSHR